TSVALVIHEERTRYLHIINSALCNCDHAESAVPGRGEPSEYGAVDRDVRDLQHRCGHGHYHWRYRPFDRLSDSPARSNPVYNADRMALAGCPGCWRGGRRRGGARLIPRLSYDQGPNAAFHRRSMPAASL